MQNHKLELNEYMACPSVRRSLADGWERGKGLIRLYNGKIIKIQYLSKEVHRRYNFRVVYHTSQDPSDPLAPGLSTYLSNFDKTVRSTEPERAMNFISNDPDGEIVEMSTRSRNNKKSGATSDVGKNYGSIRCKACGKVIRLIFLMCGCERARLYYWYNHKLSCEEMQRVYALEFDRQTGDTATRNDVSSSSEVRSTPPITRSPSIGHTTNRSNSLAQKRSRPRENYERGPQHRPVKKRRRTLTETPNTLQLETSRRARRTSADRGGAPSGEEAGSSQDIPMSPKGSNTFHFENCTVRKLVFDRD